MLLKSLNLPEFWYFYKFRIRANCILDVKNSQKKIHGKRIYQPIFMNVVPLDAAGQGASLDIKLVVVCSIVFIKIKKSVNFYMFLNFWQILRDQLGN